MGIGLGIGLIIAILSIKAFDPIVIIITAICGGYTAGTAAVSLIGMDSNPAVKYGVPAAVILICVLIQFIMRSRQVGKKQAEKADEMKLQASRENEVEQARMLLDGELDDLEDAEDLDGLDEEEEWLDDRDVPDDEADGPSLEDDDDFTVIDQ